jgi:hypothetical protein
LPETGDAYLMASERNRKGQAANCPACDTAIYFKKRLGRGQFVICRQCDSLLEVLSLSPLRLAWAFEEPLNVPYLYHDGLNVPGVPDEPLGWD